MRKEKNWNGLLIINDLKRNEFFQKKEEKTKKQPYTHATQNKWQTDKHWNSYFFL